MLEEKPIKKEFLKAVGLGFLALSIVVGSFNLGAQAKGKTFSVVHYHEMTSMDPHDTADLGRSIVRLNMYDGLTCYRENDPPVLKPYLAESWEAEPGSKEWTFHLRKGVLFHDGSEMTSEDVVYSVEKLLNGGRGMAGTFSGLLQPGTTEAVDKYTVKFHLTRPFSPFAGLAQFIFVLNKDVLQRHEENGDYGNRWLAINGSRLGKDGVGTGAYGLKEWQPGSRFIYEKFPDYFQGWDQPHMENIRIEIVYETATQIIGLKTGRYDFMPNNRSWDEIQSLMESPLLQEIQFRNPKLAYISLNNQKPLTSDVHFRKALNYAFDYGTFLEIEHGYVERSIGYIPNTIMGHLDPEKDFHYTYDLDKAREHLAKSEVDYKKYEPLEIVCLEETREKTKAEVMLAGLSELGINARIRTVTFPVWCELANSPETAPLIGPMGLSPFYIDPDHWAHLADPRGRGTYRGAAWYENPKVTELQMKALATTDEEERIKLYQESQRIVLQDAPIIFLGQYNYQNALNKDIGGVDSFCPYGGLMTLRDLYFKSEWE